MPMPTGGAWPPPAYQPAYSAYADWDAWYAGNPDRLRDRYQHRGGKEQSNRTRPSQFAGGIIGRFSRWLWGTPPPMESRDARLHVPAPADLAAVAANLLFAEMPSITATGPAGRRVDQLFEDGLAQTLLHAAEAASALGDIYLTPVIDREVSPRAFLVAHHADAAIPVLRWGRVLEVTFWSVVAIDGQTYWRLLEHHRTGRIEYGLFQGSADQLGRNVPLTERAETTHLADLVDEGSGQDTGLDVLDVVHIPNAGPQRLWRTDPLLRYYGRSDFDGAEQWFDALDETWTAWMRDIRLAKARLTIPAYMLHSAGPGAGAMWDPDREIYSAINSMPEQDAGITASQFAIRHVEHKATADSIIELILRHVGISPATIGDAPDGQPVTATEIQQRERQTFITRGRRIEVWAPRLAKAISLLMAVERAAGLSTLEPVTPVVEFGDSVADNPETLARTAELLRRAEAASTETLVRMVRPNWDDTRVNAEVARILAENGRTVQDPESFTGGPGGFSGGG